MVYGLLSLVAIYFLIKLAEKLRRDHKLKPEVTRKFVHISVGTFVAFWPFFMSNWIIFIICFAFIGVVVLSRLLGWFDSIHAVERKTWGDILFPLGIAMTLLVANNKYIFMVAMLHLALADGIAALVGEKWGHKTIYRVNGYKKTLVGNLAFFATSIAIMLAVAYVGNFGFSHLNIVGLIAVPIIATILETIAIGGMDNLVVPVILAFILNVLIMVG